MWFCSLTWLRRGYDDTRSAPFILAHGGLWLAHQNPPSIRIGCSLEEAGLERSAAAHTEWTRRASATPRGLMQRYNCSWNAPEDLFLSRRFGGGLSPKRTLVKWVYRTEKQSILRQCSNERAGECNNVSVRRHVTAVARETLLQFH